MKSRKVPAADDKWQFVARPDRKTKAINSQQKAVLHPEATREDLIRGLIFTCAHEIEGHVLQHQNKSKVPLRLFRKLGGDRRQLMAEGGAVFNEETLLKEIFGYERPIATYYLLAMEAKHLGGDYLDCLKAVYRVELSRLRAKYDLVSQDQQKQFQMEVRKNLAELVPKVKRIFQVAPLTDRSGLIPETKDTVYLEQNIMMKKLAERGLAKLAFIGGMNLKNVAVLLRLGLLKMEEIEAPRMITRQIWEELREEYSLESG